MTHSIVVLTQDIQMCFCYAALRQQADVSRTATARFKPTQRTQHAHTTHGACTRQNTNTHKDAG